MKVYQIDWRKGIPEPILDTFFIACKLFMISMLGHPELENKDISTKLYFTHDEQTLVDSFLSRNNSR